MEQIITYLFSSTVMGGILAAVLKKYLEGQVTQAEKNKTEKQKKEYQYKKIDIEFKKAVMELLFWIVKGLTQFDQEHEYFNGEVAKAYERVDQVKQDLDNFETTLHAETVNRK